MSEPYSKIVAIRVLPGIVVGWCVFVGQLGIAAGLAMVLILLTLGDRGDS